MAEETSSQVPGSIPIEYLTVFVNTQTANNIPNTHNVCVRYIVHTFTSTSCSNMKINQCWILVLYKNGPLKQKYKIPSETESIFGVTEQLTSVLMGQVMRLGHHPGQIQIKTLFPHDFISTQKVFIIFCSQWISFWWAYNLSHVHQTENA